MKWIVVDFGGVISHHPPEQPRDLLVKALDTTPAPFWTAYWDSRLAYDGCQIDAPAYWTEVCARLGHEPPSPELLDTLIALDVNIWTYYNNETLWLLEELGDQGHPMALLSNAPVELARVLEKESWAQLFKHRFFSADLKLTKPDPRIYQHVWHSLDAQPEDLRFIDDRQENITAAGELGMQTALFTTAPALRAELPRLLQTASPAT